jgi:AmpD protein
MTSSIEPAVVEPAIARIDADGWLIGQPGLLHHPSPNHDARPAGSRIELIVIHAISLPPGEFGGPGVLDLFANQLDATVHPYYAKIADLRVSAHFFIRRSGQLLQCVSCLDRAWHAGQSCWRQRARCNDFSLGIELEGDDSQPFSAAQYATLRPLLAVLRQHFPITAIVGHADIAAGRKTDPGPYFDWSQLLT